MGRIRDAITGLFTTKAHAEANPDTTVREAVKQPRRGRRLIYSELQGLNATATELARVAVRAAVARTAEDAADRLRINDTTTAHGDLPSQGLCVTVTVQVTTGGRDAVQADD